MPKNAANPFIHACQKRINFSGNILKILKLLKYDKSLLKLLFITLSCSHELELCLLYVSAHAPYAEVHACTHARRNVVALLNENTTNKSNI